MAKTPKPLPPVRGQQPEPASPSSGCGRVGSTVLFFAVLVASFFVKLAYDANEFKQLQYLPAECGTWRGARGVEDVDQVTPEYVVLSSDNRAYYKLAQSGGRKSLRTRIAEQEEQGQLWLLSKEAAMNIRDGRGGQPIRIERVNDPHVDHHPHGIAIYREPGAADPLLFVAQHLREGECVVVYSLHVDAEHPTATYVETVCDPALRQINDVAVVRRNEFYITNWLYYEMGSGAQMFEIYTQRQWGYAARCKRTDASEKFSCAQVTGGLGMANGIVLSPKLDRVYVVATIQKSLVEYIRHDNGSLTLNREFPTQSACDNAVVGDDGRVCLGCHPKILTYTLFDQKYLSKAPSHVLVVDPATGAMENKLLTDGAGFSASSVGFPWEDMFIVGSSKDDGFLVCRRK